MRRAALALALLAAAGCGAADAPPAETTAVRGVFLGDLYGGQAARIDHEAIPGQMDAMQMDFRVARPALLEGLAPGDKARFGLDSTLQVVRVDRLPAETPLALRDAAR